MAPSSKGEVSLAKAAPRVDLTRDAETLKQGSEQWKRAVEEVREALETHGYLLVKYDAISEGDRERLCEAMHGLFSLPVETKAGSVNYAETFQTYVGKTSFLPLYENLRVNNAGQRENAEAFTRLMWPTGNDEFCNVVHSVGSQMTDLSRALINMILEAYGLGKYQETVMEASDPDFRMIRYAAPEEEGQGVGIPAHADITYITVLGQNDVPGLSIKNNQGDWVDVDLRHGHFIVFVAQSLRALTNGRLHATYHQVNMSAVAKERLSYGVFLSPKPDQVLQPLPEMVDDEHPPLFKPFVFKELAKESGQGPGDALSRVAGM